MRVNIGPNTLFSISLLLRFSALESQNSRNMALAQYIRITNTIHISHIVESGYPGNKKSLVFLIGGYWYEYTILNTSLLRFGFMESQNCRKNGSRSISMMTYHS